MHTSLRIAAVLALSCATLGRARAQVEELPAALDPFLMTERHGERQTEVLTLGGLQMNSMAVFSELPYLIWPAEGTQLAMDRGDDLQSVDYPPLLRF